MLAIEQASCLRSCLQSGVDGMDDDTSQRAGGLARASNLTPERRQEIAREAAKLRWRNQRARDAEFAAARIDPVDLEHDDLEPSPAMPIARWRGALNLVGVDVPCYVLDDGQKIIGRTSATEVL